MKILLSNDDGVNAEGIMALVRALSPNHQVTVCAPARQQSGMGHAITVFDDMVVESCPHLLELGAEEAVSITGTPADCVKLYLEAIAPGRGEDYPDLIISGINHGGNLGTDVLYSGTVGAALEGYMHGINTLAVSVVVDSSVSYDEAAMLTAEKIDTFIAQEPSPFLLNINFPKEFVGGTPEWRWAALGHRDYLNAYTLHKDGSHTYYRLAGEICDGDNEPTTDIYAIHHGLISVTPLYDDLANVTALRRHNLEPIPRRPLLKQSIVNDVYSDF